MAELVDAIHTLVQGLQRQRKEKVVFVTNNTHLQVKILSRPLNQLIMNIEFGKCEICGNETSLDRTYFRYDIQCECHSPRHFELVRHCNKCVPVEPKVTQLTIKTDVLNKILLNLPNIK